MIWLGSKYIAPRVSLAISRLRTGVDPVSRRLLYIIFPSAWNMHQLKSFALFPTFVLRPAVVASRVKEAMPLLRSPLQLVARSVIAWEEKSLPSLSLRLCRTFLTVVLLSGGNFRRVYLTSGYIGSPNILLARWFVNINKSFVIGNFSIYLIKLSRSAYYICVVGIGSNSTTSTDTGGFVLLPNVIPPRVFLVIVYCIFSYI